MILSVGVCSGNIWAATSHTSWNGRVFLVLINVDHYNTFNEWAMTDIVQEGNFKYLHIYTTHIR